MLARPHRHEGDPAVLTRPAHARSSEVFQLPAGAEMTVIFLSAAWSSAQTRSWRSISPGRAVLGARPEPTAVDTSVIAPSLPGTGCTRSA